MIGSHKTTISKIIVSYARLHANLYIFLTSQSLVQFMEKLNKLLFVSLFYLLSKYEIK